MIDIKELRVGNWVFCHVHKIPQKIRDIGIIIQVEGNKGMYSADVIYPIPLSPTILEKCGFEDEDIVINEDYEERTVWKNSVLSIGDEMDVYYPLELKHIKYLHQLQNLYFALTGQELNYQP